MVEVAAGAASDPTGTVMLLMGALALSTPPACVQPCTFSPVEVVRLPLESTWKLPPREYRVFPWVS